MDKELLMLQLTEIAAQLGWDITAIRYESGETVGVIAGEPDAIQSLMDGNIL